jgi:SepF-like predicted cell division protein (DUF552 family)
VEEQSLVSQLCLKTISIHDYSQLSELKNYILGEKQVILIARITPLMEKDPDTGYRLMADLYCSATNNNYSIFRLGEERVIIIPHEKAIQYGKEYLASAGQETQKMTQEECQFCHIQEAPPMVEKDITTKGYYIQKMEGCPA